jgi:hypothetical protein
MGATMQPTDRHRWGPLGAGGALVGVLALLGAVAPPARPVAEASQAVHGPIRTITLPDAAPAVPDGPNLAQFQAYCRLCHSPRLVLTQPRLPRQEWGKVVKKMVNVYKAPIPADQQEDIVVYLTAVRGPEP